MMVERDNLLPRVGGEGCISSPFFPEQLPALVLTCTGNLRYPLQG